MSAQGVDSALPNIYCLQTIIITLFSSTKRLQTSFQHLFVVCEDPPESLLSLVLDVECLGQAEVRVVHGGVHHEERHGHYGSQSVDVTAQSEGDHHKRDHC